jgi:hypothetical protein
LRAKTTADYVTWLDKLRLTAVLVRHLATEAHLAAEPAHSIASAPSSARYWRKEALAKRQQQPAQSDQQHSLDMDSEAPSAKLSARGGSKSARKRRNKKNRKAKQPSTAREPLKSARSPSRSSRRSASRSSQGSSRRSGSVGATRRDKPVRSSGSGSQISVKKA